MMLVNKPCPALWAICRLIATVVCASIISGCATIPDPTESPDLSGSGRDRVLRALKPQKGDPGFFKKFGFVSTALSSSGHDVKQPFRNLDPEGAHGGNPFSLKLADGTLVEGLYFPHPDEKGPKPLLLAGFGFLQDRWGTESAKFHELYLKNPSRRLPAHVLILDHPTAGTFLANNGHLSIGSYDDAKMWIEIARHMKERIRPSGIHLFGVSMSGQTVVHALIEDARLGLNLFDSGVAVSIAPDFQQAPGNQLARLKTPEGVENPWKAYFDALPKKSFGDEIQGAALGMLIKNQFVPHYRYVHPENKQFDLQSTQVAVFLRQACETRIAWLRNRLDPTWNTEAVSLDDLDAFMAATRIAEVIDRVRTPLALVSSFDDPAVERTMFAEVMKAAEGNRWIAAYETDHGGHFGFDVVYGANYLGRLMRLMISPQVFDRWLDPAD